MKLFLNYWKALNFAIIKYGDLKRKSGDIHYFIHPLRITLILRATGYNEFDHETLMIAALFHDLIEDTDTSLSEIENKFGKNIASIVNQVSIPIKAEKEKHLKNLKNASIEAKIIKLADRLDNLIDLPLEAWSKDQQKSYAEQAKIILESCGDANSELALRLKQEIDRILNQD
ncbi:MAG: HD domain-containing protein [Promethearchaeota archaeon]